MATGPWPAIGDGLWAPPPAQLDALFSDDQQQGFFGGSLARLPSPPPLSAAAHLLGYPPQVPIHLSTPSPTPPLARFALLRRRFICCSVNQSNRPCSAAQYRFFSAGTDNFDVFHEQDLARLAAQVAQKAELQQQLSKRGMLGRADDSSFPLATPKLASQHASSSVIVPTLPSHADSINTGSAGVLQALQGSSVTLDRPADDGYNWRKYGQKAVKGGKYPRSYYKCTLNCPVRKNVEHSLDGRIIKIVYRGQHCHERPSKRFKVCGGLLNELDCFNDTEDASSRPQFECQGYYGKPITSIGTLGDRLLPTKEEGDEQFSGSGDSREEGDDEIGAVDGNVGDNNANERNAPGQKIIVSTTSDVDLLDDGYRWRKYGQKVVRGNPHPRSYYKCTFQGCDVKKHIERSSQEPHAVITTYEGKHIHDVPASRNRVQAAGQPYCTEETYTDQTPANFCSSSEKRNYGTITLNHLAF